MKKKITIISFIILLMILMNSVVFASETGTIKFKATDSVGNPVDDLDVKIYKVAETDLPYTHVTDDFKTFDIGDISETNIAKMEEHAINNVNPILTRTTNSNGEFTLNIETGIYLLVQSNRKEDCTMQTMFISIPEVTENGINYEITVKPKIAVEYGIGGGDDELAIKDLVLPQTGIVRLPIIILAASGIALFCISWVVFYTKKKIKQS